MDNALLVSLTLVAACVISAYFYISHIYSYWKRRNVAYAKPIFPFGNFKKNVLQQISIGQLTEELYNSSNEPVLGFYAAFRASLLIRDPEIIQNVLIRDFSSFSHRGLFCNEKVDPLTGSMLLLNGDKWRNLRSKLSPAFTYGKLKGMFPTIVECGDSLQKYVAETADANDLLDVREIFACYSTNVIASVAFGIDIDCIQDPNCEFRHYGKKVFDMTFSNSIRNALAFLSPTLMSRLRVRLIDKSVQVFMTAVTKQNLEYREKHNIIRKDFFQLLMQLRDSGRIAENDEEWRTNIAGNGNKKQGDCLTLQQLTAQSFLFFAAGFETASTTQSFCLYELARAPDIQHKVHQEIDAILSKHNGILTFDAMNDMKYLECCIDETLRRRPPVPLLPRQCIKDFKLTNSIVIEAGIPILIPISALHHDPKYWSDPYTFDPNRFNEANHGGKLFVERPYLPFGDGPRNCIGMRLGKLQIKVGLVLVLQKFRFELADEHVGTELEYSPSSLVTAPKDGIRLKVIRR